MNIEEAIKLLEEFKKNGYSALYIKYGGDRNKTNSRIETALENLLNNYKKTKQELESVKEIYYTQSEIDKHFIPKAKVTETIREYQKRRLELVDGSFFADPNYINNDTALVIGISVLQDLLQKKGEI